MNRRAFLQIAAGLPLLPVAMHYASPRILVIGDSVTWGQGLLPSEKMHVLLAQKLFAQNGVEPLVAHYARSGAKIGYDNGQPTQSTPSAPWEWREVPEPSPTLREQCDRAATDHPDKHWDYIILCGGINDVGVETIFWPATTEATITGLCERYCNDAMSRLLDQLADEYVSVNPAVKVIVLGYYSVLSEESHLPSEITKAVEALSHRAPTLLDVLKDEVSRSRGVSPQNALVSNSQTFYQASRSNLQAAVAAANTKTNTFLYVDPAIAPPQAAFTNDEFIFGLKGLGPEDDVASYREQYCKMLYRLSVVKPSDAVNQFVCDRASVGHPNRFGAARYADVIWAALQQPAPTASPSAIPVETLTPLPSPASTQTP